jgi:hypothetical protein
MVTLFLIMRAAIYRRALNCMRMFNNKTNLQSSSNQV